MENKFDNLFKPFGIGLIKSTGFGTINIQDSDNYILFISQGDDDFRS